MIISALVADEVRFVLSVRNIFLNCFLLQTIPERDFATFLVVTLEIAIIF